MIKKIAKKSSKSTKKKPKLQKQKKPSASFMKPMALSNQLKDIIGNIRDRKEVVKKIWSFIKKNKLPFERKIMRGQSKKGKIGTKKGVQLKDPGIGGGRKNE